MYCFIITLLSVIMGRGEPEGVDDTALTLTKSITNGNVDIVISDTDEDISALETLSMPN